MKIVITGHTSGVGKTVYNNLIKDGHEVVGLSRTTGFDLKDIDSILEQANGCDVFINNTYHKDTQLKLAQQLNTKCKMVVFGSIAADYSDIMKDDYSRDKRELQDECNRLSTVAGSKLLYLKLTFLEDAVSSPIKLSYQQVYETIAYWLKNPYFSRLDYDWDLTEEVKDNIRKFYDCPIE